MPLPDITIDEKRYIRVPAYLIWIFVVGWTGAVVSFFDLRNTTENTAQYQKVDHKTITEMNENLMRVTITLDDFKNTYERDFSRYIRETPAR